VVNYLLHIVFLHVCMNAFLFVYITVSMYVNMFHTDFSEKF
jgi:hypothetical protein